MSCQPLRVSIVIICSIFDLIPKKYDPAMTFQRRSFEHEAPLEDFLWYLLTHSLPRSR